MNKTTGYMVVAIKPRRELVNYVFNVDEQGGFHSAKEAAKAELKQVNIRYPNEYKVVKVEILITEVK